MFLLVTAYLLQEHHLELLVEDFVADSDPIKSPPF